jgi:hypothetical protein
MAEEKYQLRELVIAKKPVGVIAGWLGRSNESVRLKMIRLFLVIVDQVNFQCATTTSLEAPEVPSIETTLKSWWAAMNMFGVI